LIDWDLTALSAQNRLNVVLKTQTVERIYSTSSRL